MPSRRLTARPRFAITAAVLAAALTVAGCGGSTQHRPSPTTSPPTRTHLSQQSTTAAKGTGPYPCVGTTPNTRALHFRSGGERLTAAVMGTGPIGVVLANESENVVCRWEPFPAFLAAHGMRVLAFAYGHGDLSQEVQAAARSLRRMGARRLVLIGASIGGAVVIDAADHLHPPPQAVISLSAVPEATLYPFPADAHRLKVPIFQIGGTEDQLTRFGQDTRQLFKASPSPGKRILLMHVADHGTDFVGLDSGNRVRNLILAFIRAHARH